MVSKASEDFPDPEIPVKTISESLGSSRWTSFRLCSRAPLIVSVFLPVAGMSISPATARYPSIDRSLCHEAPTPAGSLRTLASRIGGFVPYVGHQGFSFDAPARSTNYTRHKPFGNV